MRPPSAVLIAALALSGCPKSGGSGDGVPVTVQVQDADGDPIGSAIIRHQDEKERHKVNLVSGSWTADRLYLPGGAELVFTAGMPISFEVSASGYLTETVHYVVRKRRNVIEITLTEMDVGTEDMQDPLISFGRDKPIGGTPVDDEE